MKRFYATGKLIVRGTSCQQVEQRKRDCPICHGTGIRSTRSRPCTENPWRRRLSTGGNKRADIGVSSGTECRRGDKTWNEGVGAAHLVAPVSRRSSLRVGLFSFVGTGASAARRGVVIAGPRQTALRLFPDKRLPYRGSTLRRKTMNPGYSIVLAGPKSENNGRQSVFLLRAYARIKQGYPLLDSWRFEDIKWRKIWKLWKARIS